MYGSWVVLEVDTSISPSLLSPSDRPSGPPFLNHRPSVGFVVLLSAVCFVVPPLIFWGFFVPPSLVLCGRPRSCYRPSGFCRLFLCLATLCSISPVFSLFPWRPLRAPPGPRNPCAYLWLQSRPGSGGHPRNGVEPCPTIRSTSICVPSSPYPFISRSPLRSPR